MYYVVKKNTYIIVPDTGSWAVKGVLANIEASRNINWSANLGLYPIGVRQPQILVAGDNPPYICNGEPITLQSNYPDDQLAWSTGATTSAITVQQAGQYTLSLTDHGCTLYDTLFVGTSSLQANLVTVDADCPNHANGSITANVTGDHSPYTYQWNGNGMAPANTSQITNLSPGTYSLTVTDDAGCQIQLEESVSFDTETLQVCIPGYYGCPATLAPLGDYGCRNPIFAVVSGGETPYQYGWYVGDGGNSSLPNHVVYISTVDYVCPNNIPPRKSLYLLVQDACGQSKVVEITSIMLNGVSDDPVEVKLRPNPATNHVEVSLDVEGQIDIVEVYDVCGKLLQTARGGSQTVSLSVSALASGLYFVRVKSDAGEVVRTLVKR
ncbi:MAG: T9SS type A sorting domain-containing protein [Bacteroidales bacterium]|nr:T9SS type A sorting domain-containing protein [Bacteroidales bacterium]